LKQKCSSISIADSLVPVYLLYFAIDLSILRRLFLFKYGVGLGRSTNCSSISFFTFSTNPCSLCASNKRYVRSSLFSFLYLARRRHNSNNFFGGSAINSCFNSLIPAVF